MSEQNLTPQQEFDDTYITSSEICQELEIDRASLVHARKRGLLPNEISVHNGQIFIWKRAEIRPFLDNWKFAIQFRRGQIQGNVPV